jgi:hypothetical protein
MSSCCCDSDIVGDTFADIVRHIAHLPNTVTHQYVDISELWDKSNVFVVYATVIMSVVIVVVAFKLILTWTCNSIGCWGIHTAHGGNTVTEISSAEETNGHAPVDKQDYKST